MIHTISKTWRFDAAHRLPNHQGKCSQPHGHTYSVTLEVQGPLQPLEGQSDEGMVCDFALLDGAWERLKPLLDHQDLNTTVGPFVERTTSERLAAWLLGAFTEALDVGSRDFRVAAVTVSETPSTWARATP